MSTPYSPTIPAEGVRLGHEEDTYEVAMVNHVLLMHESPQRQDKPDDKRNQNSLQGEEEPPNGHFYSLLR